MSFSVADVKRREDTERGGTHRIEQQAGGVRRQLVGRTLVCRTRVFKVAHGRAGQLKEKVT